MYVYAKIPHTFMYVNFEYTNSIPLKMMNIIIFFKKKGKRNGKKDKKT